jgi:hypothetical protein
MYTHVIKLRHERLQECTEKKGTVSDYSLADLDGVLGFRNYILIYCRLLY